jgi:hypothetical protein
MPEMFPRFPATGPSPHRILPDFSGTTLGKILSLVLGTIALAHANSLFAQCSIQPQIIARLSANDLNITVQGTCSHDCQQITVHWTNPLLPDQTVPVTVNSDDPNQPSTWSAHYGSGEGLGLNMLQDNFGCGSNAFAVEVSCANAPGCQVTMPVGGLKVACKDGDPVCNIRDIDMHCAPDGRLTAETTVLSTGSETVAVTLVVTKDGQNVVNRSFSDNDGVVSISQDFAFAAGTYTATTSVTAPASCVNTRSANFTFTANQCAGSAATPSPTATATSPPAVASTPTATPAATSTPNNSTCPECSFCGGDWTCCVAWVLVFIGLLVLIATIMYLICDPSGGGGWGWLILLAAALVFAAALWWVVVHCQFDLCRFLQLLIGAVTLDLTMVCAIEGLFPCFSALICGLTVIAGVSIRNWFIILMIGILIIMGIQVACPLLR